MENIVKEAALNYNYISQEEYLEQERAATGKHEYYQGKVFAGNVAHQLKGKGCKPYSSDSRVPTPKKALCTYPGIIIICGNPELYVEKQSRNPNNSWQLADYRAMEKASPSTQYNSCYH